MWHCGKQFDRRDNICTLSTITISSDMSDTEANYLDIMNYTIQNMYLAVRVHVAYLSLGERSILGVCNNCNCVVCLSLVRVPNLYFGSRLGLQYPKNSKKFV